MLQVRGCCWGGCGGVKDLRGRQRGFESDRSGLERTWTVRAKVGCTGRLELDACCVTQRDRTRQPPQAAIQAASFRHKLQSLQARHLHQAFHLAPLARTLAHIASHGSGAQVLFLGLAAAPAAQHFQGSCKADG